MYINWIKITERAAEGIKIINKLDDDIFTTVINYVHKNMDNGSAGGGGGGGGIGGVGDGRQQQNDAYDYDGRSGGLEELEQLVKIERQDFLLLIKTLSYILKRASTFIMKPTKLQSELKDKLKLTDNKIDVIMKLWIKNMKPILDQLDTDNDNNNNNNNNSTENGKSNELENVGWKLMVQLSSGTQQKEKLPISHLQLTTTVGEPINLECNHTELLEIYNQLETIQNELDSLRSNK